MKIAITGGSGFIGSHVADRLAEAGHHIVVIDGRPPWRADVTHVKADITDLAAMVYALAGCDVVFHLAAVSNVNDAFADPLGCIRVNVDGTATVWEAARRNGVSRAILASTVWVYGFAAEGGEDDELTALRPDLADNVYTSSKIAAELVVQSYARRYDQPFTILRYGIPFGPRMRHELVIARFVDLAMSGRPITLHGDGSQTRNFLYVTDLAAAHQSALDERAVNQIVNLEGERPVSLREIVEALSAALGRPVVIEQLPPRPGDFKARPASRAKATELLGWTASTPFAEGMRRYVDWYRAQPVARRVADGG